MLTSKPRQLHIRKVPWYGDLLPGSWRSGMPRCSPTSLMTWPCLEYGTDVQTGLQFAIPLFLPAWGRIVKAQAPDFSSSPPMLIVSWLEVSVFVLSARVHIRKLILTQPVRSSRCISEAWIFSCSCEATNIQTKIPSEKYLQLWKNFPSVFPLWNIQLVLEKLPRWWVKHHWHLGSEGPETRAVCSCGLSWVRFLFFTIWSNCESFCLSFHKSVLRFDILILLNFLNFHIFLHINIVPLWSVVHS